VTSDKGHEIGKLLQAKHLNPLFVFSTKLSSWTDYRFCQAVVKPIVLSTNPQRRVTDQGLATTDVDKTKGTISCFSICDSRLSLLGKRRL
jgi:hypothetical protein